jgi:hypothetical protein
MRMLAFLGAAGLVLTPLAWPAEPRVPVVHNPEQMGEERLDALIAAAHAGAAASTKRPYTAAFVAIRK